MRKKNTWRKKSRLFAYLHFCALAWASFSFCAFAWAYFCFLRFLCFWRVQNLFVKKKNKEFKTALMASFTLLFILFATILALKKINWTFIVTFKLMVYFNCFSGVCARKSICFTNVTTTFRTQNSNYRV